MNLYMVLAPPWAQVLPHPPPAAKYIRGVIREFDQRTVEVGGQLGATITRA